MNFGGRQPRDRYSASTGVLLWQTRLGKPALTSAAGGSLSGLVTGEPRLSSAALVALLNLNQLELLLSAPF